MQAMGCRRIAILRPDDHDPGGPRAELLRSVGEPWGDVELRIVDPAGPDVRAGEVGEIWCRSVQKMKGYCANDEATAAGFPEDRHGGEAGSGPVTPAACGMGTVHPRSSPPART